MPSSDDHPFPLALYEFPPGPTPPGHRLGSPALYGELMGRIVRAARADPLVFMRAFGEPAERSWLLSLLWRVLAQGRHACEVRDFVPDSVGVHTGWLDARACMVLELPQPSRCGAACFSAFVFDAPTADVLAMHGMRCFMLEQAPPLRSSDRPVAKLTEWVGERAIDHGCAPRRSLLAFMHAVAGIVEPKVLSEAGLPDRIDVGQRALALFVDELRTVQVGWDRLGYAADLTKSAADRWDCMIEAPDGRFVSIGLHPFAATEASVFRFRVGLATLADAFAEAIENNDLIDGEGIDSAFAGLRHSGSPGARIVDAY